MEIRRLNTLRGFAALIVVISHFSNATGLWGKALGEGGGQFGVMLFFQLSGFLMTYLYWEKRPTSDSLLSYAVSRAARVVPLYLLVVVVSFMTPYLFDIENKRVLLSHLLFLHGNSLLWTIPPEVQFYLLFALSWASVWRRRATLPFLLLLMFIGTFLLNYRTFAVRPFGFPITASIVPALPYFVLGCLFGGLYKHRKNLSEYQSHWYLLTLVLVPMLYPTIFLALFGFKHEMWTDVGVLAMVGIIFFCVVFLVPDRNSLLENRAGDFFGMVSYSLYLLHLPVLGMLMRLGGEKFGVFSLLLFVALASFTAWLSFRLIEAPSRRAIRALVAR